MESQSSQPLVVEGGDILQQCNRAGKIPAIKSPKSELADLSVMPGIYMVEENHLQEDTLWPPDMCTHIHAHTKALNEFRTDTLADFH